MQKTFMSLVLGVAIAGVVAVPSIATESAAVQENMHKQQIGRAKKALENALVAIQASGNWNAGGDQKAAMRGVETAITEVDKEGSRMADAEKDKTEKKKK